MEAREAVEPAAQSRPRIGGSVGYVIRMFPQASETFIVNEISALENRGVDVRVFSCRHPLHEVPHDSVKRLRSPVTYIPDPLYRSIPQLVVDVVAQFLAAPLRFLQTVGFTIGQMVKGRRTDLAKRFVQAVAVARQLSDGGIRHLHAHFAHSATEVAMLTGMLTDLPYSFTAHARDIYSDDVDHRLLREKLDRAAFAVTVSRYNQAFVVERTGVAPDGLRVLYNGVDLDKFSPDPTVEREPDLILAVGRLVEKKGLGDLIEAVARLRAQGRNVRCLIVGEGELRDELEAKIRTHGLGDDVELAGLVAQEELPDLYRRASFVVMPAVQGVDGNRDALPTVLLEAMGCTTPAVASRLTGIPEIVDDKVTGLLVEPGDPAGLAAAMAALLDDGELRARFGAAARIKAERDFDLPTNADILLGYIEESLDGGGGDA